MERYDKRFAARISRIAMRVAFQDDIPKITKIMAESWKMLDEDDLQDEAMVEDAFTKLFHYHSQLAKAETGMNLNLKLEEEIEDLVKEVKFWKNKLKPIRNKTDKLSESKKLVYNKKIDRFEGDIKRKKEQLKKYSKADETGIDKGVKLLDDSIRDFVMALYDQGWDYKRVKQIVHQGMYNTGYGYSSQADISKWIPVRSN